MKNIIIIGAGGHAKSCCDVIELEKKYKIYGFISNEINKKKTFNNYSILGKDSDLARIRKKCDNAFVAIGHVKDNKLRKKIFKKLKLLKYNTPKIISPLSYVSKKSKVLSGTIVMHGAIVNAGSIIEKNCIINTRSLIEHDCTVRESCHISTGAIINGNNYIGANTFLGSSSVIKQGLKIGNSCFVNANHFVKKNLQAKTKIL